MMPRFAEGPRAIQRGRLVWMVLAATAACDRSSSERDCTCELGETRCDPEGLVHRCVPSLSADTCNEWDAPEPCGEGRTCADDACVCTGPCTTGHTVCASDSSEHRCEGPDAEGCYAWGSPEPCPAGVACEGGSCGCARFCHDGDTACDPDGALLTCAGPDTDGCTAWTVTDCGEHRTCRGGACECTVSCEGGDVRCDGAAAVTACAGPDAGGCSYWNEPEPCEGGLECKPDVGPGRVGHCLPPVPEECVDVNDCDFEGQKFCMDETRYRECKLNADDGCLKLDCGT